MPNLNYFHRAILALWTLLRNLAGDSPANGEKVGGGTSAPWVGDRRGHRVTTMGCYLLIASTQRGSSLGGSRFPNAL